MTDHSHWKRHGRVGACEKQHDVVVAMAEAGATLDAIGHAVGTNKRRVREYLTRHGIKRPDWREVPEGGHSMARNVSGELNPAWRGGRVIDDDGYVLLWMAGHPDSDAKGYVREHRLVMAKQLGRPLAAGEVVDHINGIKDDNRPENLRVFPSNAEHLKATLTGVPCPSRGRPGVSVPSRGRSGDQHWRRRKSADSD